jgi:hypothetical protein
VVKISARVRFEFDIRNSTIFRDYSNFEIRIKYSNSNRTRFPNMGFAGDRVI